MTLYIFAQVIGFIGYLLFTRASFLKGQETVIRADALACSVLCLQWLLLGQMTFFCLNILVVLTALNALKPQNNHQERLTRIAMIFFGGSVLLLTFSKGTAVDSFVLIAFLSMVTSKFATDAFRFRFFAFTTALLLCMGGALAMSLPAVIFNGVCAFAHARKLTLISRHSFVSIPVPITKALKSRAYP